MSLVRADLEPFVGSWVRVGNMSGYTEGRIAGLSETAVRLCPMLVVTDGIPAIVPESTGLLALDSIAAARVFPEAEAVELVAQAVRQIREARDTARGMPGFNGVEPPSRPGPYL